MIQSAQIEVVDDQVAAILRRMSSAERSAIADRMWSSAIQAIHSMLRSEHPDWSDEQIRVEVVRRIRGAVPTA